MSWVADLANFLFGFSALVFCPICGFSLIIFWFSVLLTMMALFRFSIQCIFAKEVTPCSRAKIVIPSALLEHSTFSFRGIYDKLSLFSSPAAVIREFKANLSTDDGNARDTASQKMDFNFTLEFRK